MHPGAVITSALAENKERPLRSRHTHLIPAGKRTLLAAAAAQLHGPIVSNAKQATLLF